MNILQNFKGDLVWVLDGLDECNSKSLNELIKSMNLYLKSNWGKTCQHRFKIIVLSRPHNIICRMLQLGLDEESKNRQRMTN
ncbi:ankyrin repeat protein [Colletotrichum graminicola M1.001]|uniref:Ankyrin repeat protein n=1 Tax=Colletotrichum graminicola (strain M1.001 / M2 / FGSC 10212) TaxID=645133 RepID=E3R0L9_COLGM|nr:ankyrin repeat protein [Colletotrichum graminicola M1.001]EFQ36657.1 ankyrin repeat protein [Colletotrichum graminicola M1.001]